MPHAEPRQCRGGQRAADRRAGARRIGAAPFLALSGLCCGGALGVEGGRDLLLLRRLRDLFQLPFPLQASLRSRTASYAVHEKLTHKHDLARRPVLMDSAQREPNLPLNNPDQHGGEAAQPEIRTTDSLQVLTAVSADVRAPITDVVIPNQPLDARWAHECGVTAALSLTCTSASSFCRRSSAAAALRACS